MMKVKYYKCPTCSKKFKTLTGWGDHMELLHPEDIPEGYSIPRYFYYTVTGKTHGVCRTCKKDTDWNDESWKYNQYCNDPACKQAYVKIAKQRMINQYGKVHLLNSPEMQRKMLRGRKITGTHTMSDGGKIGYTGSYERKFVEMLDAMFEWPSADLMSPSPHTYYYEYSNENDPDVQHAEKFYIPDFFIPSLNLEVEIEQTTSGNQKMHAVYTVKKEQKKAIMEKNRHVNYVTVSDNDFTPFFDFLMKAKETIPERGDVSDLVVESTFSEINGTPVMENKGWNPDYDEDVVSKIREWAEENDVTLKISRNGEWGLNAFLRGGDTLFLVGNCQNVRSVLTGLKRILKSSKYDSRYTITLDNYNTVFLKRRNRNVAMEGYFVNQQSIRFNFDKLSSGETNIILVTGLSGSGKTTFVKNLIEQHEHKWDGKPLHHFELDCLEWYLKGHVPLENLKTYEPALYDFVYKMRLTQSKAYTDKEMNNLYREYIAFIITWCKKRTSAVYMIEGIQIFEEYSWGKVDVTNFPLIVVGTGALISTIRAFKRDGKPFKSIIKELKWRFGGERILKGLRSNIKGKPGFAIEGTSYSKDIMNDIEVFDINKDREKASEYLRTVASQYNMRLDHFNGELLLDGNKVIGHVFVGKDTDNMGRISGLWVDEAYRRSGLGYRLLHDATMKYNGIDLIVKESNKPAISLYEKCGFDFEKYESEEKRVWKMRLKLAGMPKEERGKKAEHYLDMVPSLYKPQDISELEDITCINQGDDFSKYDYRITERNLKKVQRKQYNSIAFESLLYGESDSIALEGLFSFAKPDREAQVDSWKDILFGPRELMKRELGHAKMRKFGPFVEVSNGFLVIRGINYALLKNRIKEYYKDRNVYNIFLPIYDALSYRKFEKKRIQRAEIKIDYLESPIFFALELAKLFSELGECYNDKRYRTISSLIYKRSWLQQADETCEQTTPLSISKLSEIMDYRLLDYQAEFVKQYPILKAQLNLKGYCLAFEQGLGKTLTAVALAECLEMDHVYIVCPNTSDMPQVWKREIKKYIRRYNDPDTFISEVMLCNDPHAIDTPNTKYYIVNNESIRKMMAYVKPGKNMLILDESHNFRNIKGKRTAELLSLQEAIQATDTLCMSGTPVKGTPNEICPILKLIDPTFTNKVAEIYNRAFNVHHEIALSLVKSRFGRIMLRQTKEVLGNSLPPKEYKDLTLQISNPMQYTMETVSGMVYTRYHDLFQSGLEDAKRLAGEFDNFIAEYLPKEYGREKSRFLRLVDTLAVSETPPDLHEVDIDFLNDAIRAISSNIKDRKKQKRFDFVVKNYLRYNLHCRGVAFGEIMPKKRNSVFIDLFEQNKEMFLRMIQSHSTKTIIFSQFRQVCKYIHESLIESGIGAVLITGETSDRMDIIDAFKENDSLTVMVATPKTLGVGVTLTEASQMFFFGPPWRNSDYEQCADRIHRIGQTRAVTIYNVLLDTGGALNLTGRMNDILEWSKRMVGEMVDDSLNKTTEDQFVNEVLSANESTVNIDEIRELFDLQDDSAVSVSTMTLPENALSKILTIQEYFRGADITTSVSLPEGLVLVERAMWWEDGVDRTFHNLRWSKYASAVFGSLAESDSKSNVSFRKVVKCGIPHWQLITLKQIRAGSKLRYHPHTSDMSFSKDLE